MQLFEFLHAGHEGVDVLLGAGVVGRGAEAADGAVALDADDVMGLGEGEELVLEVLMAGSHHEADVHYRTVGLVGGAAVFIAFYFGIGHFSFGNRENIKSFRWMTDVAAVCIPAAHSIGRIGCLTAGCCHGIVYETAKWYTFRFLILNAADECIGVFYALPVQLYEALFLAVLALALGIMKRKNKTNLLPIYMIAYGVWRFLIEYIRGDERGTTIVDFLSPSQLTSVLMVAGGILLLVVMIKKSPKNNEETEK